MAIEIKWIFPLKMVIFHSYVSLPEGRTSLGSFFGVTPCLGFVTWSMNSTTVEPATILDRTCHKLINLMQGVCRFHAQGLKRNSLNEVERKDSNEIQRLEV